MKGKKLEWADMGCELIKWTVSNDVLDRALLGLNLWEFECCHGGNLVQFLLL